MMEALQPPVEVTLWNTTYGLTPNGLAYYGREVGKPRPVRDVCNRLGDSDREMVSEEQTPYECLSPRGFLEVVKELVA
jgi:hypothetical protein